MQRYSINNLAISFMIKADYNLVNTHVNNREIIHTLTIDTVYFKFKRQIFWPIQRSIYNNPNSTHFSYIKIVTLT